MVKIKEERGIKMARFCTYCGSELKDGKCPKCSELQTKEENKSIVSDMMELIKGMFVKPVDTMKEFIQEENLNQALVSLGISATSIGLLICIFLKMTNFMSHVYFPGVKTYHVPYVKIMIVSIVLVSIIYLLLSAITYFISTKCFKSNTSYQKIITWLGATASLMTVVYLVSAIGMLMHTTIGTIIFVAGSLLNTYYMYKGLSYACDVNENKLGYILMPSVLSTSFIIGYILPRLFC